MKKLNTRGFGLIEGLAVLLIVAVLGGGGWYVWQARQDKNNINQNETSAIDTEKSGDDEVTKATGDALEISQLGIKLPLEGLKYKDLEYTIGKSEGESKNYTQAYVTSSSLREAIVKESGELPEGSNAGDGPTATIVVIPTADFKDGFADYPMEGMSNLSEEYHCVTTVGTKKVCVLGAFMDYGFEYQAFVESIQEAAKNATEL